MCTGIQRKYISRQVEVRRASRRRDLLFSFLEESVADGMEIRNCNRQVRNFKPDLVVRNRRIR